MFNKIDKLEQDMMQKPHEVAKYPKESRMSRSVVVQKSRTAGAPPASSAAAAAGSSSRRMRGTVGSGRRNAVHQQASAAEAAASTRAAAPFLAGSISQKSRRLGLGKALDSTNAGGDGSMIQQLKSRSRQRKRSQKTRVTTRRSNFQNSSENAYNMRNENSFNSQKSLGPASSGRRNR